MSQFSIIYTDPYRPTQIKINSLGIGINDDTLDALALTQTEFLIVGERRHFTGEDQIIKTYGLIVDHQGIGVNTTLEKRVEAKNNYAMSVDGNLFVSGAVIACNIVQAQNPNNSGDGFWNLAPDEDYNIYYTGNITLGNSVQAQENLHRLNIVESADRNITHAQLSIQNNNLAQMRMAIIGSCNISPFVVNTRSNVPIEFHVGRDQNYFSSVYGLNHTPIYTDPSNAPHLCIDRNGNIGIRTDVSQLLTYRQRQVISTSEIVYPEVNERANLAVYGTTYSCNLLIWDYESGKPENLDMLYIRRRGVTLEANQIIPGDFAVGQFRFRSNVIVQQQLTVEGNHRVTDTLSSDHEIDANFITTSNLEVTTGASFRNDTYFNNDVIIKEGLRVRGGIFTEVIDGSNVHWCNVQFTVANPGMTNINVLGTGITTPGRLGVGISPSADAVNHQFTIMKRSGDIVQMELFDKTNPRLLKGMYIGHPATDLDHAYDGSVIFATPNEYDPIFNRLQARPLLQNFYFYPGTFDTTKTFSISDARPPVLNISVTKKIGINKFNPSTELDVNGNINFSGDMYKNSLKVGIWNESQFPNIQGNTVATFTGLRYSNPQCCNIGINMPPDIRYALSMYGSLRASDYYTANDDLIIPWMSSDIASAASRTIGLPISGMFTMKHVGIGVDNPKTSLELKNYARPTVIRLYRPDSARPAYSSSYLDFVGTGKQWILGVDFNTDSFQIATSSNVLMSPSSRRALWMNTVTKNSELSHQVIINGGPNLTSVYNAQGASNPDPNATLIVDGDMAVLGNVRITGQYIINGTPLMNSNITGSFQIPLATNDVFIAGDRLFMNPNKMFAVGYDANRVLQDTTDDTLFRVYQGDPDKQVIGKFLCSGDKGFIEIANTSGSAARIGFTQDSIFSIMNRENKPFFSFTSNAENGQNYMAFNNGDQLPNANFHIFTTNNGEDMLRLTRVLAGSDVSPDAPEIELEKRIFTGPIIPDKVAWTLHGPDGSYKQKLAFLYKEGGVSTETICFTKDGCIGIGNSTPEYALDIRSSAQKGSLRLLNTSSEAFPQIILQSGSAEYGSDILKDYRFYAACNTFGLDTIDNTNNTPKKLIHVACNNTMGILTDADEAYNLTVFGSLNVKDALYVNGYPILIGGSNLSELFPIRATNIVITPGTDLNGGVTVNYPRPSCNLFYIRTDNSANALSLDSILNQCQMHFRCTNGDASLQYSMYRIGGSNDLFRITHFPNSSNNVFISDSTDGYKDVIDWGPSKRLQDDYDATLYGSVYMKSAAPLIKLATSEISYSNEYIRILTTNDVGIGTTNPQGKIHVVSDRDTSCIVQQFGAAPIATFHNRETELVRISNDGKLGINVVPRAHLDVMGDAWLCNIIPQFHDAIDIGSNNRRFRDIYASESYNVDDVKMNNRYGGLYVTLAGASLSKVACHSVQLGSEEFTVKQLYMTQQDPVKFTESNLAMGTNVNFVPFLHSSATQCFAWNTSQPLALMHVINQDSNATMMLDHVNSLGTDVLILRNSGCNIVNVKKTGNVGIGTTTPNSTLHVFSCNINSAVTIHQASSNANVLHLISTSNQVVMNGIGMVGIGTTKPQSPLHVNGTSIFTQYVYMAQNLEVQGNSITHGDTTTDSDIRLKSGLERITDALDKVCSLTGYTFNKHGYSERSTGLVAQDVEKVLPECVRRHPDTDFMSVAYGNMMGLIVEAIKEIRVELNELKSQVASHDQQ